jgi:hypothetical protein
MSENLIDKKFNELKRMKLDINEHFDTLKKYASECDTIVELGVRYIVSTWALLSGRPKKMVSVDIKHPSFYKAKIEDVYNACNIENINFSFVLSSSLDIVIDTTDLLFIDTLHTYDQLSRELKLHGNKSTKYIILHDTETFKEILPAINEFLTDNPHWEIKESFKNNNGLTILKRHE